MTKKPIKRVVLRASNPVPRATNLEGYTKFTIPWNDGTGENLYVWIKPDEKSQTVYIGSDENLKIQTRQKNLVFKTNTAGVVSAYQSQATLEVIQTNAVYNYRLILSSTSISVHAAGAELPLTAQLEAKIGDEIIYTRAVEATFTLEESEGFTLQGSTLSVANRGTYIGNQRSCIVSAVVNAPETGEEVFGNLQINQEGNYIEEVEWEGGSFSYDEIGAGATSATPKITEMTPRFHYTSGQSSAVVPSSAYGTWEVAAVAYSLAKSQNGFTAVNTDTGVLTATHRGTTIGDARTSATVSRLKSGTWTPSANFNAKGSKTAEDTLTATCTQAKNVPIKLELPSLAGYYSQNSIPASGGSVSFKEDSNFTVTWSSGSTSDKPSTKGVSYSTGYANFKVSNTEGFSIDRQGKITASSMGTLLGSRNSGDVTYRFNVGIYPNSGGVTFKGLYSDKYLTITTPVTQGVNERTQVFAKPNILTFTAADIPASGGSVSSGTITYKQLSTWDYTSGATSTGPEYTTGATITYGDPVSAESLGTTVKARTEVGILTATVTLNGQTSTEGEVAVFQAANAITEYGDVSLTVQTPITCDVGGGDYRINPIYSQTVSFTSGDTRAGSVSVTYTQKAAMTGFSLSGNIVTVTENKTTSARNGYTVTVKATGEGSKTASKEVVFNQSLGVKSYATPVITGFTYPTIAAKGGTVTPTVTYSQTWGWNESTTNGGTITTGAALSFSGTGVNTSTGAVTAGTKGTTVSSATNVTTATVKVTLNNKAATKTFTVQQAANVATITYGNPVVHLVVDVGDIPAGGGSVSSGTVTYSQSRTQNYTSGATSPLSALTTGGQISYGDPVIGSNLGAIETDRSYIGSLTVTVTMNGKSGSDSVEVYQEANVCIDDYIDYGAWIVYVSANRYTSSSSPCPAGGGTCTISTSASRTRMHKYKYTSGTLTAVELEDETATPTLSIRGTGASLSGTTVTWASRGTTTGEVRQATITAKVEPTSAKEVGFGSAKEIVYQQANAITETTYSNPTVSISSVADIPAKGGSVSTGTATYSQTKTDTYTSGSSKPTTITSGGTVQWSTVSAGTKGTTVSARTEVDEITCTVTLNSKSGSATKMVYQAANSKNEVSRVITVSVPSGDIPAEGGTKTVTRSGVINYSFTSGSTTTSSFTPTLSISGTGFSLNGTTVTAANRSTTVGERRSATVTASYEGATSKTATVYQQENEVVSITYGTPQVVLNVSDIPASGGTVSSGIVNYLQSRTRNYTSGATSRMSSLSSGGVITYSDAVSGANLGTTEKERTKLGTLTATVTMNGKSDSDSADVYQEANVRTAGDISYGDWQVSVYAREYISASSPCPASGDSFTIYSSASRTRVQEYNYTSGATDTEILSTETATPELSVSGEGGLILDGNTATYANRGTTEGNLRSNTILATYEGAYDTEQVYQEANVKTTGDISYGNWQVSVSANRYTSQSSPCPASGGTCTITASASRTRTQNYSFTSGATSTSALTNESGNPTLSISGTGASLSGTTVTWANRTTIEGSARSATVTATMDTVATTEVVYQAENVVEENVREWGDITDVYPEKVLNFSSEAGSIETNVHITQAYQDFDVYSSGSRKMTANSSAALGQDDTSIDVSESLSWVTAVATNTIVLWVTVTANTSTSDRSGSITISGTGHDGKTYSKSVTVSQGGKSNYLNVSPTSLSFTASGGTKSISIHTNESWTIS